MDTVALAHNQAKPELAPHAALCVELPSEAEVPDWIELIPAGERVQGVDGRWWINDRPRAVAEGSALPRPLDWEHATELRAPKGDPAPAAGWIEALDAREDGSVWGRIVWTAAGQSSVANRDYRYVSPVFLFAPETKRIVAIVGAGLTNRPNFRMRALNHADPAAPPDEEGMDEKQRTALCAALGLAEAATDAEIVAAAGRLKREHQTALNQAQQPPLDKFVPRADYDTQVERATNAEKALAERDAAELKAAAEAAVDEAVKAGKVTPATRDYYLAQCQTQQGLDAFKSFAAAAPVIADHTELATKPPETGKGELTPDQLAICQATGTDPEAFKKALA